MKKTFGRNYSLTMNMASVSPEEILDEKKELDDQEREQNHGVEEEIKSKTVVKFSAALVPAPFTLLQCNTNLNLPPSNWLSNSAEVYGMPADVIARSGFSSFSMANKFPDCVGVVDVVSDAENIKKLMKMTRSSNPVSLLIHRVEKTLLIDDFDLKKMLLASEGCWEWFRVFFERVGQAMQVKPKNVIEYNDRRRMVLQQKRLISKFLYHSLVPSPDATTTAEESEKVNKADPNVAIPLPFIPEEPQLPEPPVEEETPDSSSTHTFARNVVWNFEDIQMLLGTDLPIFGGGTHPCVSLRLRDMNKPINVLTGMDYWLDNLMCNVPEVVMCYHLNGIVQRYELIKTEDLPQLPNSKFSPKVIRDIAQNILSFLKSNATKAGHTYWLFKGRDDDVVKLYDLTSLCSDVLDGGQTPFTVPVAMLLYRVARNMKHQEGRRQASTICTLLKNCVKLLPAEKYPEIATSAHFMLADVFIPSDLNPKEPDLGSDSSCEEGGTEQHDDDYSIFRSMSLASMCEPIDESIDTPLLSTPLSSDVLVRCHDSLRHVLSGLKCLRGIESSEPPKASSVEPIPMSYQTLNSKKLAKNTENSDSQKNTLLCKPPVDAVPNGSWSWNSHLKSLLYEKAVLIYLTLLEYSFRNHEYGETLRHAVMALRILRLLPKARLLMTSENTIYGAAGDALLFIATQAAPDMGHHNTVYRTYTSLDSDLLQLLKADGANLDVPCTFPIALESVEAVLLSSAACYGFAANIASTEEQRSSFHRRLGNIENEIGVFYMNKAYGKLQEGNSKENLVKARDFLNVSETHLEAGIAAFQKVEDAANLALLYSNTGRLMRHRAHVYPSENATRSEDAQKERVFYNKAIHNYHLALDILGERSANPAVWDSVFWELSTTYYVLASLLQDFPAGDKSHEEAERELTDTLHKALKYCDLASNGARLPNYQFRCAEIHHRLASLHHSQYRFLRDEGKGKHVLQLSRLHYEKASKLLLSLEYPTELIKIEMERIGLAELLAEGSSGVSSKSKHYLQALEHIVESKPMLELIIGSVNGDENDQREREKQHKLLSLMLQRLQFILLNLTKLAAKRNDDKKCGNAQIFKRLYSLSLKCNASGTDVLLQDLAQGILTVIKEMQESLMLPIENIR